MSRKCLTLFLVLFLAGCGASTENANFVVGEVAEPTRGGLVQTFEIPHAIDDAYVERVMTQLEDLRAAVRRDVYKTKRFTDGEQQRFNAIFAEPALTFQSELWKEIPDLSQFKPDPGSASWFNYAIMRATPSCIWFKADVTEGSNVVGPPGSQRVDIVFVHSPRNDEFNPTGWRISQFVPEQFSLNGATNVCA